MLDVNPDTVCRLVELAREFHAQDAVDISDEPEGLGDAGQFEVLAEYAGDATLQEFRSIIEDLEPAQQQQVVALLWLGREDYTLDQWDEALEYAAEAWTETTADYLITHPLLADYLEEGLAQHGHHCD